MVNEGLQAAKEKMRAEGVPDAAIATFEHYYEQLVEGESGMLPDDDLDQLSDVPAYEDLPGKEDREALDKTVVIKLNGGLGTSMGMQQAKSLLEVKEGRSFLDIIAGQVLELRKRFDARLPLVLMNSFYTRDDTLEALERHPELESDVPADFVQNKEPKLLVDDLTPVEWPDDPDLEWCPPGHGDVYTALQTSGTLDALLEHGYEYAFLSNSDNLGAVLDPRVLSWFAAEELPFVMEVCEKTPADRKGGHPAVLQETGRLVLRETAQTPEEDLERFSDIDTWKYFNTNNLWVNLRALKGVLEENDGVLGLPMIVNRKTVDPGDKSTPEVFQIETAMGAAVGVFEGAQTLVVPRRRFAPVKTTSDLLVLRSDAYVLTDE
jgi:UTP--glucose-1-phosphate uridylyltransferase